MTGRAGPLAGLRVVEMQAAGPAPFAAMMLADLGADVIRVAPEPTAGPPDLLLRGRPSVAVDLTHPEGTELVLRLAESAEALIEGFRPGHMEGLGLGPAPCALRNPALVYARMTGWGQEGPAAYEAGHDINFIAVAGALRHFAGADGTPVPPLNLLGDFGAGGMMLAFGLVSAVLEARQSGLGQVVDAAMLDGTALLMTSVYSMLAAGEWAPAIGTNIFDGGAPFYAVYATADGEYVSVGAVEEHCYRELLERLGFAGGELPDRADPANWPLLRQRFAGRFRTRDRASWLAAVAGSDACVTPVLSVVEAPAHPHNRARQTFVTDEKGVRPAPAPRFSRTPGRADERDRDPDTALAEWGIDAGELAWLRAEGVLSSRRTRR